MNFLAGISETLCFSREFLRRYVSRGHILKSVGEGVKDNYKTPQKTLTNKGGPPKFHL